jgi:arginase
MFEGLLQQLNSLPSIQGATHSNVLRLPAPILPGVRALMKKGRNGQMPLSQIAQMLQLSQEQTLQIVRVLVEKGYLYEFVESGEEVFFRIRFGQRQGRDLPLSFKQILQDLKPIQLIEVNSDIGAGTVGANYGAAALREAALQFNRKFFGNHDTIVIESQQNHEGNRVSAKATKFAKNIQAIYDLYQQISAAVQQTLNREQLPILIAGDHSTAGGTIVGIKMAYPESKLGVIWIDAHADIHSPYTTPSGNMHGMPVATALAEDNLAHQSNDLDDETIVYWDKMKNLGGIAPKVAYEHLIYIAVRDTEWQENALIEKHNLRNFTTHEVREKGVEQVVQEIAERLSDCDRIYISFDVDSLDPAIVSEGTGTPVAGGLTDIEAAQLISRLIQQGKVCCFEVCEINPQLDQHNNRMAQSAFGILERAVTKMASYSTPNHSPLLQNNQEINKCL